METCGKEFARRFAHLGCDQSIDRRNLRHRTRADTALSSRLAVVYARKTKPITMPDQVYLTLAPSHTKGRMVELIISPEYLTGKEKVLIIDDFLASGATILGLVRLGRSRRCKVVGIGTLIEKSFRGGRDALKHLNLPVELLARIASNGCKERKIMLSND